MLAYWSFCSTIRAENAATNLYCIGIHLVVNGFRTGSQESEIKEGSFNMGARNQQVVYVLTSQFFKGNVWWFSLYMSLCMSACPSLSLSLCVCESICVGAYTYECRYPWGAEEGVKFHELEGQMDMSYLTWGMETKLGFSERTMCALICFVISLTPALLFGRIVFCLFEWPQKYQYKFDIKQGFL